MNESTPIPEARAKLEMLSRLRGIAKWILEGPRAVMFSDDPEGLNLWLEPILRMKTHFSTPKKSESFIVYSVPNCLQRTPTSPVLIRRSSWESGKDKDLVFNKGVCDWPTIATATKQLHEDQLAFVDKLVRDLDESLNTFPFPAEGLDLSGPSGFKPIPENAVITTNTVHNELYRIFRFYCVEFHWSSVQTNLSRLDWAWQTLFQAIVNLTEHPSATADVETVEKYDINPVDYYKLLKSKPD